MSANPIVHWEIMGPDGSQLREFYGSVFDWALESVEGFESYFTTEGDSMGVNGAVGQGAEEMPTYQCIYVGVEDIDTKLTEVEAAGGSTVIAKTSIPDVVTFAMFRDPAGNLVGIVEGSE